MSGAAGEGWRKGRAKRDDKLSPPRERNDMCGAVMLTESIPIVKYYKK